MNVTQPAMLSLSKAPQYGRTPSLVQRTIGDNRHLLVGAALLSKNFVDVLTKTSWKGHASGTRG